MSSFLLLAINKIRLTINSIIGLNFVKIFGKKCTYSLKTKCVKVTCHVLKKLFFIIVKYQQILFFFFKKKGLELGTIFEVEFVITRS
jgi:hypothetical protein